MNKEGQEKKFVDMIITKGGVKKYVVMADGNHGYYHLELNNGDIRYWSDFSNESLQRLGLLKEEGLCLR